MIHNYHFNSRILDVFSIASREDKIVAVKSEKSKKKKKDKAKLLTSPETDVQDRPSEDLSKDGDGKRDETKPFEQEKEELNQEARLDENNGKPKKRKKTRDRKAESPEKGLNSSTDKFGGEDGTKRDEGKNGNSELAVDHAFESVLTENSGKSKKKKKGKVRGGDTPEGNADLSEEKIVRETIAEETNSGKHYGQADAENDINDLTGGINHEGVYDQK